MEVCDRQYNLTMIDSQPRSSREPASADLALLNPPILSSRQFPWNDIVVDQFHLHPNDLDFLPLSSHLITVNLGRQGNLVQQQDGRAQEVLMATGSITLTPAGQSRRWRWDHEADVLQIQLSPQFVTQVAEASEIDASHIEIVNCFGSFDPQVQHIGISLLAEVKTAGLAEQLYVESLVNLLTIHLLRNYSASTMTIPQVTGRLSPSRLRQAIEYIQDNLAQTITLADLAKVVNLSPYHFARLFRQETGLSPHQYLIRCRVEKAQRLLSAGRDILIGDVAHRVGFADQSHLTRYCKRILGVTPKAIVQNSKNLPGNSTNLQDISVSPDS